MTVYSAAPERSTTGPSKELGLDEQIEEARRKRTEADVRMKKHPELWPHAPSDRYGTRRPLDNAAEPVRGAKSGTRPAGGKLTPLAAARQSFRQASNRKVDQQSAPANTRPTEARVNNQEQEHQRLAPGSGAAATAGRPASRSAGNKSAPSQQRQLRATYSAADRTPSSRAPRKVARTELPSGKSVFQEPQQAQPISRRQQVEDSRCPDDSGVEEIDSSSSVSISDGNSMDTECRRELDSQNNISSGDKVRGEDTMRLGEARRELEELARREAEARKQRQLIVENILSKFNSIP